MTGVDECTQIVDAPEFVDGAVPPERGSAATVLLQSEQDRFPRGTLFRREQRGIEVLGLLEVGITGRQTARCYNARDWLRGELRVLRRSTFRAGTATSDSAPTPRPKRNTRSRTLRCTLVHLPRS